MRIMIASRDSVIQATLRRFLSAVEDAEIAAECASSQELMETLSGTDTDAMFLDTQTYRLPEPSPHQQMVQTKLPYIIAITLDETLAIQALEQGATDFLLNPVSRDAVSQILIKLRYLIAKRTNAGQHGNLSHLLQSITHYILKNHAREGSGKLFVKVGTRIRVISLANILYAQASGDYLDITMTTGESVHTKEKLAHLEGRLPKPLFVRTHRSFIINTEHVKEIRAKRNDYELVLSNDMVMTTGSTYRKHVRDQLLVNLAL